MENFKSEIAMEMTHSHLGDRFMAHNIPVHHILKHTKAISDTKRTQVANLQNHIQQILNGTHDTFLQGSYKNDTSIADINDVDIVAVRESTYSSTHSDLVFTEKISWDSIFSEIEDKLNNQSLYEWTVERADKCIEVRTPTFKADVVPAVRVHQDTETDPVVIYSFKATEERMNSPRTHYLNGVLKHAMTNQNYKPMVRMFKNWVVNHFVDSDVVSSYQMESLVHSAPDECFSSDHVHSFILIGAHIIKLLKQRDVIPLVINSVCGSEDITKNWDIGNRQLFRDTLSESLIHAIDAYQAPSVPVAERYWSNAFNL